MIKVLIVEDEIELQRNLTSYLNSFHHEFEVFTAGNAEKGSELLAAIKVDILLTDVRLPGMSGIDLVRHAIAHDPTIKIIVMTAFSSPSVRSNALHEGALRFIEKPLDLAELRATLLELSTCEKGWSGMVQGLDIFDFAQLMLLSRKSKALTVSTGDNRGTLVFSHGQLIHASTHQLEGQDAFFAISQWPDGVFEDLTGEALHRLPANVTAPLEFLLMEAARRSDESSREQFEEASLEPPSPTNSSTSEPAQPAGLINPHPHQSKKEQIMGIPKDILNSLNSDIDGLQSAALFGSDGLPLLVNNPTKADVNAFAAKFAMVAKLVSKTVAGLNGGILDEILVEQNKGWILLRPIGKADLVLMISVSSEALLGNLRLVAKQMVGDIAKAI
jgi:DNA-binding response OmpR family regulator/predicted regulator of Ras-like GTPase activity (Roadblock/LC7/MglB family)